MKLGELLKDVPVVQLHADTETEITSVCYDSRKAEPGCLFAAVSGFTSDGNRFIPAALARGARVVVTAHKPDTDCPYVLVEDDRLALALVSANFFGRPAERLRIIGITGTNGKTSSTILLKQVLERCLGTKVGLIGTMGSQIGDTALPGDRTTPESYELQALFARMVEAGCTNAVMEVSSHALTLERVGGVHFAAAAFTNLTEDHLDFHKTMDAYFAAKAKLFSRCDCAVINMDDSYAARMASVCRCPVLTTSVKGPAMLTAHDVYMDAAGVRFTACDEHGDVPVTLGIPGKFSVYNALTVLGLAETQGISLSDAAQALRVSPGVKGRVEPVPVPGMPYSILIDYAHTPDGLENVLSSVREYCTGRLIAVFGCGGDRDPMKRPIMGKIGAKYADIAVITSDNPRTEKPMAIIEDILKGVNPSDGTYTVIEDRRKAVQYAMDIAQKDDIIVLAGKGHETYQDIGGRKLHMDEREIVADYLRELRKHNG